MADDARERGATFPQAPTQEEWEAMGPEEQARVVESLPGEVTWDEMAMPEGDRHLWGKLQVLDVLRGYFRHQRRQVYVGAELPVYYPGERRFAPDVVVVRDAEPHERNKWVVSAEGKGLDWVMEVHVGGDRKKDAEYNVARYGRLGIPEYFIYDRAKQRLYGYRQAGTGTQGYVPMEPRQGWFVSEVLGLELCIEGDRLRFWAGNAPLLEPEELRVRLEETVAGLQRRTDEESRRREEAERRLAELQAELERLRERTP
jgi:Uma2 family endonuclease